MATTTGGHANSEGVVLPSDRALLPPPPPPRNRNHRPAHAAWKPPLGRVRKTVREIGFDFITAGIVVLLFVAYQLWGTGFAEAKSQSKLKQQFHEPSAAAAPAPDSPALGAPPEDLTTGPPEGAAVAHLRIPKLGVDKFVVEGVTESALKEGPGHYPGTPLPGEPGNAAIAGHRTTYGAPFYDLDRLSAGDKILISTNAGQFLYVVDHSAVVKPSDVAVIGPTSDNRLTLTTCNPRFSATTRLIVVAMLTDLPVTPPSTIPHPVVVKAVNLGTGDHSAWPPTLLYGLLAVGLWIGVRVYSARRRDWRWAPILAGIPVCFVPLWFLFENAIRLLPNNI